MTCSSRSRDGSSVIREHPMFQLALARMREFYREPEAVFWVFGFPIVLAFALGLAFRNTGPGELQVGVAPGAGDSALAATLDSSPRLIATALDTGTARLRLRTGRIALLVVPGDTLVYRYDSTRTESGLARLEVDAVLQRARGRQDLVAVRDDRAVAPGSRYIDFLIPGLLGMNLLGSGIWGVGFSVVQARQRKLLKRYMATPMRKSHYLLSFIFSRLVFLILEVAALVGFGWLLFGVAVRGSFATLAGMWILSGTFFSYARFPDAMIPFVKALPLTALNDSLRAVMIDGAGLATLGAPLGIVVAWGAVSFVVALQIF